MIEDDECPAPNRLTATNDNAADEVRIDQAVRILARLLGRQMAREDFERLTAANDNQPPETGES